MIQFNWVTSDAVVRREQNRHRLSAWMQKTAWRVIGREKGGISDFVDFVATGLWPVQLVGRAILCPPVRFDSHKKAGSARVQSDAPYLLTTHRAVGYS